MDRNERRTLVQKQAADKWEQCNYVGTLNMHTGSGKNFAAFRCILKLPEGTNVLLLAEVVDRQLDVFEDIKKFKSIFGVDLHQHYNIEFNTYQSASNISGKEFDLVWADEIHDSMTETRHRFFKNNEIKYKLGTSATLTDNVKYDDPKLVSKKHLIHTICPIIFKYTMEDGRRNGTSRKLNVFVINHWLDKTNKNVKAGNSKKRFMQTEAKMYDYITAKFDDNWSRGKKAEARRYAMQRANFLYNLKSKEALTKNVLSALEGNTVLFGNSISALEGILPGRVISSRNSDDKNEFIRESFESGALKQIGAFKKLEQGANLSGGVDNTVIHSYYSKADKYKQRVGRSRVDGDKVGNTILIRTMDSKERKWSENLLEIFPRDLYNVVFCRNIIEFKHYYSIRERYENTD